MQRVEATEKPISLNIHRAYFSGYNPPTYMIQRATNRTLQWRNERHYRLLANQIVFAILFFKIAYHELLDHGAGHNLRTFAAQACL